VMEENGVDVLTANAAEKLQLAFVGGAYDSAVGRSHRIAVEMDQRLKLVAGCFSRHPEKSYSSAIKYGMDPNRAYSDLGDLLNKEVGRLDGIVILTPQDQHFDHVMACLNSNIPVVCEKALVGSVPDALTIRELLIKKGYLAVMYNYTGYPMLRELKRMVASGILGKIQQILMEMPQEGFARLSTEGHPITPQAWRLRDGSIPTLSLDLGVHLHMIARFLTGESPEEVVTVSSSRGNFPEVVDNVHCLTRYSGGIDCNLWYGKTAFGNRNGLRLRIFGDKGAAEWVQENPEYLYHADNSGGKFLLDRTSKGSLIANQPRYQRFKAGHPAGFIEALANYYVDVAETLQQYHLSGLNGKNQYVFGIDESLEGLRMLEAITRSSFSHKWERVV
jgi:predicted dehydrogenase